MLLLPRHLVRWNERATYRHLTYDLTTAIAQELAARSSALCFVYVSGAGTDSTERGRSMWARVKGATENAMLAMPFRSAFMFRPGVIQPLDGIRSKTRAYRLGYVLIAPVLPLLRRAFPNSVSTTREIGQAMLAVARNGWYALCWKRRTFTLLQPESARFRVLPLPSIAASP